MTTYYPNTGYTLLDRMTETLDGKNMARIIQCMNYYGVADFFADWPAIEASHGLKHMVARTTTVPSSTRQAFDAGVAPTVTHTQNVWEDVVLFAQRRSIHDKRIDTLSPSGRVDKLKGEDDSHRNALGKDIVYGVFNDAPSSGGEYINGLLSRMDALNSTGLNNVQSAGCAEADATTRILIVELNPNDGAYLVYPPSGMKNTQFGIYEEDKGKEPIVDPNDSLAIRYDYVAIFEAWLGMAVGNNLKMGCLANVSPVYGATGGVNDDLFDKLNDLLAVLDLDYSRTRMYINRTLGAHFTNYSRKKNNINWPTTELFGKKVKDYMGIPIRELDNKILLNTLAVVS